MRRPVSNLDEDDCDIWVSSNDYGVEFALGDRVGADDEMKIVLKRSERGAMGFTQ